MQRVDPMFLVLAKDPPATYWLRNLNGVEIKAIINACQTERKNATKIKCSILISFQYDPFTLQYLHFAKELWYLDIFQTARNIRTFPSFKCRPSVLIQNVFICIENSSRVLCKATKSRKSRNYSEIAEKNNKKAPMHKTWQTTCNL